jgi:hypothetical protein
VSWSSKKQNSISLSTGEAEYVAAGACCAQLLWMKQTLRDFGCEQSKIPLLCDNEGAIKLADNPVNDSRTKHIDVQHVRTEFQLADIFTKPLDESRFCALRHELNIIDSRNVA